MFMRGCGVDLPISSVTEKRTKKKFVATSRKLYKTAVIAIKQATMRLKVFRFDRSKFKMSAYSCEIKLVSDSKSISIRICNM